jgi:hypothetical protein
VDCSTSVKRNVTVPRGSSAMLELSHVGGIRSLRRNCEPSVRDREEDGRAL